MNSTVILVYPFFFFKPYRYANGIPVYRTEIGMLVSTLVRYDEAKYTYVFCTKQILLDA